MRKMTRFTRNTLLATLSLSILGQTLAAPFDWQRFKGTSINIMIQSSTWADTVAPLIPEFEKKTGIKVNVQLLPEQQARQKLVIDFASGGATVDVFETSLHTEKALFSQAGWYEPLNSYLSSDLAEPNYRYDEFFTSNRLSAKNSKGQIVGLPTKTDVLVLFYRKDLFAANRLAVPKSIDDIEAAAKVLNDPPNLYGFAARGLKNANVFPFSFPLKYYGGNWVSSSGTPTLNSAAAAKALDWYSRMLRSYAPKEVVGYNWNEILGLFQQGKLAMFTDSISFATQIEDPSKSKVAGKVGYAVLPGNIAPTTGGALAISSRAKNKQAAFYFIQWATDRAMNAKLVANNVISPRSVSWQTAPSKPLQNLPWAQTYFDALKVGKPVFPEITTVTEMRDTLGIAIVQAVQGTSSKAALTTANDQFKVILNSR